MAPKEKAYTKELVQHFPIFSAPEKKIVSTFPQKLVSCLAPRNCQEFCDKTFPI
jgi:hypothetical protein